LELLATLLQRCAILKQAIQFCLKVSELNLAASPCPFPANEEHDGDCPAAEHKQQNSEARENWETEEPFTSSHLLGPSLLQSAKFCAQLLDLGFSTTNER
jgi:hypothetical protein